MRIAVAEFQFYGTWNDARSCLEAITALGPFTFVLDKWYAEPIPKQFTVLDENSIEAVRKDPGVYVLSAHYTRFPVRFGRPTPTGLMRIWSTESGVSLHLSLPVEHNHQGRLRVGMGLLSYQAEYHDPVTGQRYMASEELKRAYAYLRSVLCRQLMKRYVESTVVRNGRFIPIVETLWIGRSAIALLDAGQAEILVNGEFRHGSDLKNKRAEASLGHDRGTN